MPNFENSRRTFSAAGVIPADSLVKLTAAGVQPCGAGELPLGITETGARMAVLAHNTKQLLIALDQAANAAMGFVAALVALWPRFRQAGLWWADETISAHCWRWHINGVRSWPRRLVDGVALILGDENHCLESYKSEVEGRQLPPEMRE